MNATLRKHAEKIIKHSISAVLPDDAVLKTLRNYRSNGGKTLLVAVGKAAWQMANAAIKAPIELDKGIVITKYNHVMGELPGITCYEAGHPVPDENSFAATKKAMELAENLTSDDTVIFLLSGGGSALFEYPLIPAQELQDITNQLLACGAGIVEMNTIRKRLSAVKGGRFAELCAPARVISIVLSDIPGDPVDMIASGPTCADTSTCEEAQTVADKYGLKLSPAARELLKQETPKSLKNTEIHVNGSVKALCSAAAAAAKSLGYEPIYLTDQLSCEAKEAGSFLASILKSHAGSSKSLAFIAGGETVVHLTGNGRGGRNQELALASSVGISHIEGAAVFSLGSDGTDGPTDAAGGYADYETLSELERKGFSVFDTLSNNDAYTALKAVDGLIFTGPTGTNVNDVAVALLKVEQ